MTFKNDWYLMIDISWSHLTVLTVIALILLGPKELPVVLRMIGRWIGYGRAFLHQGQQYLHALVDPDLDDETAEKQLDNQPLSKTPEKNL